MKNKELSSISSGIPTMTKDWCSKHGLNHGKKYKSCKEVVKMAKINRNEIARDLAEMEGLKNQINIGDIKELMRVYNTSLTLEEVVKLWLAYNS